MEKKYLDDLQDMTVEQMKEQVMKRFDDKPIGVRLNGSYKLIIAVIVIICLLAIFTNLDALSRLKNFKAVELEIVDEAWSARQNLANAELIVYQIFASEDSSQNEAQVAAVEEQVDALNITVGRLKTLINKGNRVDKALIDKAEADIAKYIPLQEQAVTYGLNGQLDEAKAFIMENCLPLAEELNKSLTEISSQAKSGADYYVTYTYIRIGILAALLVIAALIAILRSLKYAKVIVRGITTPLDEVEEALGQLAEGNLDFDLEYSSQNEIGRLADMTRGMAAEFHKYIISIAEALQKMANKDFTVKIDIEYKGEFENIKSSFEGIMEVMSGITTTIKSVAFDVSEGSSQIAEVSQSLADGASDQSGAVQELLATIQEISQQVDQTAKNVGDVSNKSVLAQKMVNKGNAQMQELMNAMQEIAEASEQISAIIAVINGISSQTNLLALNASIEAARAGEQGKGFAVVADEIGQLAGETNEATKNTRQLIQRSLETVKKGVELARETASALDAIVGATGQIKELANEVSEASSRQAQSLVEINSTVQMVADVAQTNAAAAQQSAASSNELTYHAQRLAESLNEFKLNE